MKRSTLGWSVSKPGLLLWLPVMILILSCSTPALGSPTGPAPSVEASPVDTATASAKPGGSPTPAVTPTLGTRSIWRNSSIAFASNRDGTFQLYLIQPEGSGLTRLTDSEGDNLYPAWSPDAQRIAFASTRDGNSEIYVMNADGTRQTNISRSSLSRDYMPLWLTKDRIAFISDRNGRERIFLTDANGENVESLKYTSIDAPDQYFCLTLVQEDLLSFTVRGSQKREVRLVDVPSGKTSTPQILNPEGFDRSCPLSPTLITNPWIVYVSERDGRDQIYKFDPDREQEVQLTDGPRSSIGASLSSNEGWLTFYSQRTGDWDIFVMNTNDKNQWNITNSPGDDIQPAWQPY